MSDGEQLRDERDDPAREEDDANERLEDLEPAAGERAAVKGGGPRNETVRTGGDPET